MQIETRAAEFAPDSFNAEEMTVEAVASTFADVARGGFVERLDPAGLDLSGLIGRPVLDGHKQGAARDVLGVVTAQRIEAGRLIVTLKFTSAPDAQNVIARVREGVLRGVSIGYRVSTWREEREGGRRVRIAARWEIIEISAVAIPADTGAHFRSIKGSNMTEHTISERDALVNRCRAAYPALGDDWSQRMAEAGDVLTAEEVIADARATAATARAATPIQTAARAHEPRVDEARAEALAVRMGGGVPSDAARAFMCDSMVDHARASLLTAGHGVRGLTTEEVLTRAFHTTSDFPLLLTAAGNRVLAAAYKAAESPLRALARQRTAADFRELTTLRLGGFGALPEVSESGEIIHTTTAESAESFRLKTFAHIFGLTRRALLNDDLGAFGGWAQAMGRAAAETEAREIVALLTSNPVLSDGAALFHASHGNQAAAGGPIIEESLSEARRAMRTQKGLSGEPIGVAPAFLVVGPERETEAEKILASVTPRDYDDVNPFSGTLKLLVEPRITDARWYVFAEPSSAPVLEVAHLASAPGPQLSQRDGFETLGRDFRVVLDFGCGVTDHRGAFFNAGV